ncbi:MAG: metal-sensitive transcriptional regulator [Anaerolineae bacterium]|nr:MAG: metal-sensitive transcriptional regulator [Anaerolineae bacterium]
MKNEAAAKRLRTIQGHVGGIARMVDDGEYCIDVIRQIQAVQAALNKVNQMVLDDHMHHCVITAVQGDDASERERVLAEITDVFQTAHKL